MEKTYINMSLTIRIAQDPDGNDRISKSDLRRKIKSGEVNFDQGFIIDPNQNNKIIAVIEG